MNTFEIEALMDEEIERTKARQKSRRTVWRWSGTHFGVWYCRGCNGGRSRVRFSRCPAAELGALIAHAMVGTFLGFYWLTDLFPH